MAIVIPALAIAFAWWTSRDNIRVAHLLGHLLNGNELQIEKFRQIAQDVLANDPEEAQARLVRVFWKGQFLNDGSWVPTREPLGDMIFMWKPPTKEGWQIPAQPKIFVVGDDRLMDSVFRQIDLDLMPEKWEDINTIAYISTGSEVMGRYVSKYQNNRQGRDISKNPAGMRWVYTVWIIDLQHRIVVKGEKFSGTNPPRTVKGSHGGFGNPPSSKKIAEFIDSYRAN